MDKTMSVALYRALHYIGGLVLFTVILLLLHYVFQSEVLVGCALLLTLYTSTLTLSVIADFKKNKTSTFLNIFFGLGMVVALFYFVLSVREESLYWWWIASLYIGYILFSCIGVHAYVQAHSKTMFFAFTMLIMTIVGTVSFYPSGALVLHHRDSRVDRLVAPVMSPLYFGEISPFTLAETGPIPIQSRNSTATHDIEVSYAISNVGTISAERLTTLYKLLHGNVKVQAQCNRGIPEGQCMYITLQLLLPGVDVFVKEKFIRMYGSSKH